MNALGRNLVLVGAVALVACAQPAPAPTPPPDTRAADEATLRATIKEWAAAAQAKDAVRFVSFYTEDAVVMMAGAPDISGMPAIREGIGHMMRIPPSPCRSSRPTSWWRARETSPTRPGPTP